MKPPEDGARPVTATQGTTTFTDTLPDGARTVKPRRSFIRWLTTLLCSLCWTCESRASRAETEAHRRAGR
jgi:hypothetical protein